MALIYFLAIAAVGCIALWFIISVMFRTVVPTNDVHIVQSGKTTTSYGREQAGGNVYYSWPSAIPKIGIKVIELPMSVFSLKLDEYAGYDKDRVPFIVDVVAFFRIENSAMAATRIASFDELQHQLNGILRGAIRNILATSNIEEILEGRSQFGDMFTKAVDEQLKEWGVTNVKKIEIMDIRDAQGSKVIANIMAKKSSTIERESRVAVAENLRAAKEAEIAAAQQVDLRAVEAKQMVGVREATAEQQIGVQKEQAAQTIKEQQKITSEKEMAVVQVQHVRSAEIEKQVEVVKATQAKEVTIINADGEKQNTITIAEGVLEQQRRQAEGIAAIGEAKASAEKAMQLAPVSAQIELAREIGQNEGYQQYLVTIKQVDAAQAVGVKQAEALQKADIKVIANSGSPADGLTGAMDLVSSAGGLRIGALLEGLKGTPTGAAVIDKLTNGAAHEPART